MLRVFGRRPGAIFRSYLSFPAQVSTIRSRALWCSVGTRHSVSLPEIQVEDPERKSAYLHIYDRNEENSKKLALQYKKIVAEALQGGGERGIKRHVERNKKVLVRERIKEVLDPESPVVEIGTIAGHNMEYGNISSAGVVSIIGKIHGTWCMVIGNDATVKGGSVYPITLKKQLRCQDIASENLLPCVYLMDSGGAFLPLQSEIFNPGGKTFRNQAVMSSEGILQVAFVCGSCTAGAAYVPTMAQETVIQEKIGTIFLGGPPLVKAATGEIVSPEELGGADLHCRLSGCSDHFVKTEQDGFKAVRNIMLTSNSQKVETHPWTEEKNQEIPKLASSHIETSVNAYEVLKQIADDGGFHEYKQMYGNTIIAGFMFINKCLVGVLANNGYMTEKAAKKGCNFVQFCTARHIPILFLQNTCHDELTESEDLKTGVIKTRAAFMQAVATSSCPKIVISIGGLVGSPHSHPMCSLSMGARFHFVWPNVRLGSYFPWNSEYKMTIPEFEEMKTKSSAFYGASRCWYDGIVLPEDTRELVYLLLNIFEQEQKIHAHKAANSLRSSTITKHTVIRM